MMNQAFDPLNLLILAIAVVVFLRLRSVLGKRTGHERPPLDPYAAKRQAEAKDAPGNVINLPQRDDRPAEPAAPAEPSSAPVWTGLAEEGSSLARGLEKIAAADRSFSPRAFLDGAKMAYEMIVQAFAAGDRPTLRNLLSREVLDGFLAAIDAREKAGNKLESRFVGIDKAELAAADLKGKRASVTVKFVSELISATRDRAGEVIEGDPQQIREITDVWTFERDVSSRDPNWKLAATEVSA
jgi:predicted lipid-binding transport protein (Tim44 family)